MFEKTCAICGDMKPIGDFFRRSDGCSSDGRYVRCKVCYSQTLPPDGYKRCVRCDTAKPTADFREGNRVCRACRRELDDEYVIALHGSKTASNQERYKRNRDACISRASKRALEIRQEVISHYGGFCKCCGERELRFLTLDHIGQDGAKHRKETNTPGGTRFYYWVRRNGYPDFLRVLCYNCNMAMFHNGGTCPHEDIRLRLVAA